MAHLEEELIAQYAAGFLASDARRTADIHLASCETCRSAAAAYQRMVAALTSPLVSRQAMERIQEMLRQRVRLKQFIQQLISDPTWRVEVQRDPQTALERHRIRPTPQLVAALKELSSIREEGGSSQLDERISKLLPPM
ncbi:MAG: hypothetical protein ACREUU_19560 [Gammaproteobacteria bacterium]